MKLICVGQSRLPAIFIFSSVWGAERAGIRRLISLIFADLYYLHVSASSTIG
jgi:hypothetical protein